MRAIPITLAALAAALLLTACDSGTDSGNKDSGSKNADLPACRIGELEVQVGPANAAPAAGDTGNVPVTLTNQGAQCTLEGFPDITLSAGGSTATVPEDRTAKPEKLTLAKGGTASFTLTYVRGEEGDAKSLPATSLKLGLPGTTGSQDHKWSYGPVQGKKDAGDPDASVTALQQAGD
ncbi:DUF4232 domain-containing protein [Streptomyces kebangsaanensis]|uniref:DUF4232 domain-containing protein n=1 Tax=Streptomyces kebangsaanensis TaxID=864058 RepID=UPI00093C4B3A|nr:DUF4232 domain-containing protein [Streptomyces kebangsaanensis]